MAGVEPGISGRQPRGDRGVGDDGAAGLAHLLRHHPDHHVHLLGGASHRVVRIEERGQLRRGDGQVRARDARLVLRDGHRRGERGAEVGVYVDAVHQRLGQVALVGEQAHAHAGGRVILESPAHARLVAARQPDVNHQVVALAGQQYVAGVPVLPSYDGAIVCRQVRVPFAHGAVNEHGVVRGTLNARVCSRVCTQADPEVPHVVRGAGHIALSCHPGILVAPRAGILPTITCVIPNNGIRCLGHALETPRCRVITATKLCCAH
mmetsp:Transcript_25891/g.65861  ORF Transcript_25891/g.65861 Transcript_25891/m.65861 type:complete len:264 (+) Transcript_25891:1212-2003(+)